MDAQISPELNHLPDSSIVVAVIDYGMGNLRSVVNAFNFLGIQSRVASSIEELGTADAYVLPGVGAFGPAMSNLRKLGLDGFLKERVIEDKAPFLGLCLGMQILAERSSELGEYKGLGWFEGSVSRIPKSRGLHVPHVGWSSVRFNPDNPFFTGISESGAFYFDHSYMLPPSEHTTSIVEYGEQISASIQRENIFATQFHPEKSQRNGLKLLHNFSNYCFARMATGR